MQAILDLQSSRNTGFHALDTGQYLKGTQARAFIPTIGGIWHITLGTVGAPKKVPGRIARIQEMMVIWAIVLGTWEVQDSK